MTEQTFETLGIAEPIRRALATENYTRPTPIQAAAIPLLLEGRDLLGIAQTGTGKTAAFSLPMLQKLVSPHTVPAPGTVRALILAPTRELAIQILESIRVYGRHLGLRHAAVFGGVKPGPQAKMLARGLDILVATPGRLLDFLNQRQLRLDTVEMLVLDEADRMLDMGFIRDVRKIVAHLPKRRQSLLFSATMPQDVSRLAADLLHNPERIEVTPAATTVEVIDQQVIFAEATGKRALLPDLLADPAFSRVIVFTRTKHGADRVARILNRAQIGAEAIHGNKSQNARQRALEAFREGSVRVLVATDIASRGIDVDDISHVVNYDLPNEPESYVHRIGRTARAGAGGTAISFCDSSERSYLKAIERVTRMRLRVVDRRPSAAAIAAANAAPEPVREPRPQGGRGRPAAKPGGLSANGAGQRNDRAQGQKQAQHPGQSMGQKTGQRPDGSRPRSRRGRNHRGGGPRAAA